jgi:hypothetical protein
MPLVNIEITFQAVIAIAISLIFDWLIFTRLAASYDVENIYEITNLPRVCLVVFVSFSGVLLWNANELNLGDLPLYTFIISLFAVGAFEYINIDKSVND